MAAKSGIDRICTKPSASEIRIDLEVFAGNAVLIPVPALRTEKTYALMITAPLV
jgi:hypothetical protein